MSDEITTNDIAEDADAAEPTAPVPATTATDTADTADTPTRLYKKSGRRDYKISWKYFLAFIATFAALSLAYAFAAALGIPTPRELLDAVTGATFLYILLSSLGIVYLGDLLRRKIKKLPAADVEESVKICLRACVCILIAFLLECTIFQFNHYGVVGADNIGAFSTQDGETEWTTQKFKQMNVAILDPFFGALWEQSIYVAEFGLDEDAFVEPFNEENIAGFWSRTDLFVPENSADEEAAAYLEEQIQLAEAALEKGEEYVRTDPTRLIFSNDVSVVSFANLNRPIASLYVEPMFVSDTEQVDVRVIYSDEESTHRETSTFKIIKGAEHSKYVPVYPVGDCSEMHIVFMGGNAAFLSITVNEMIPLTPVLLRILFVFAILFAIDIIRHYDIFKVKVNWESRRQNIGFAVMLILVIAFSSFNVMISPSVDMEQEKAYVYNYNKYLVDALLNGQLHLDLPTSSEFLAAERQYDWKWLELHGMNQIEDYNWDVIFYAGKWYAPHPIVPAVLVFLPYTAITGQYLPYGYATILFGSLAIIFLAFIFRRIAKKFLPGIPYIVYILMTLALTIATFIPFNMVGWFYELMSVAGVMFVAGGLLLLMGGTEDEKPKYIQIALACLCFALSVGCRPTMICFSVFVPMFTWKYIKQSAYRYKTLLIIAIPYIIVAAPLMWYNYARFGSPLDFGAGYGIGNTSGQASHFINIIGKRIYPTLYSIEAFLFNPPAFSTDFRFVASRAVDTENYAYIYNFGAVGLFVIPVNWLLFGAFAIKDSIHKIEARRYFWTALAISFVIIVVILGYNYVGGNTRYSVDYSWLLALAAFICTGCVYEKIRTNSVATKLVNSAVSLFCLSSVIMFMFLGIHAINNYEILGYLLRAFNFFGGV